MSDLPRVTKDSERLVILLYKQYVVSVKSGIPRSEARLFGDYDQIADQFCPGESVESVSDLLWELARADYLEVSAYDDMPCECELTMPCIVMMENRFKDGIKSILDFLTNLV